MIKFILEYKGRLPENVCVVPSGKLYFFPKLQESIIQVGELSILRRHHCAITEDDLIRNIFKLGAAKTPMDQKKSPSTLKHLTTEGSMEAMTMVMAHSHFILMSKGLSPSYLHQ